MKLSDSQKAFLNFIVSAIGAGLIATLTMNLGSSYPPSSNVTWGEYVIIGVIVFCYLSISDKIKKLQISIGSETQ